MPESSTSSPQLPPGKLRVFIDSLEAVSQFCNRVSRFVLIAAGIIMSVVVFLQVVFRFFIRIPLPWSEELSRYLMVWVGMLGASLALAEGRHIGVDLLMGRLRGWVRQVLMVAGFLGVIWFLWVVVREGAALARQNYSQLSPAMMIPMLLPYAAIPVGGVFMLVQIFRHLVHTLLGERVRVVLEEREIC